MQYESSPANSFEDIVQKRNTDTDMVMTTSPAPTLWAGDTNDTKR